MFVPSIGLPVIAYVMPLCLAKIGELVEELSELQAELTQSQEAFKLLQKKADEHEKRSEDQARANSEVRQHLSKIDKDKE